MCFVSQLSVRIFNKGLGGVGLTAFVTRLAWQVALLLQLRKLFKVRNTSNFEILNYSFIYSFINIYIYLQPVIKYFHIFLHPSKLFLSLPFLFSLPKQYHVITCFGNFSSPIICQSYPDLFSYLSTILYHLKVTYLPFFVKLKLFVYVFI